MAQKCGMNTSIEHNDFILVLDYMARAADFIASSKSEELEVVGVVDGIHTGGEEKKQK